MYIKCISMHWPLLSQKVSLPALEFERVGVEGAEVSESGEMGINYKHNLQLSDSLSALLSRRRTWAAGRTAGSIASSRYCRSPRAARRLHFLHRVQSPATQLPIEKRNVKMKGGMATSSTVGSSNSCQSAVYSYSEVSRANNRRRSGRSAGGSSCAGTWRRCGPRRTLNQSHPS